MYENPIQHIKYKWYWNWWYKTFFLIEINVAFEKSSLLREVLEPFGKMEWTHFYNRYFDNRYGYV